MAQYNSIHTGPAIDAGITKANNPDTVVTAGSNNLVTSGAVKTAINAIVIPSELTAGTGVEIEDGVSSAKIGNGLTLGSGDEIEVDETVVQPLLTAGTGIEIDNNVISATGVRYVDGPGIEIMGNEIGVKLGTGLDLGSNDELIVDNTTVQAKLTAGANITISPDNVISASGGGGGAVNSVNGKTGVVVLNAGDIRATNTQTIQANLERIDERIDDIPDYTGGDGIAVSNAGVISAKVDNTTIDVDASGNLTLSGVGDGSIIVDDTEGISVNTNVIQAKLTAGTGITISGNVISASGAGGDYVESINGITPDETGDVELYADDIYVEATETSIANNISRIDNTIENLPSTLPGYGLRYDTLNGNIAIKGGDGMVIDNNNALTVGLGEGLEFQNDAHDIGVDFDEVQAKLTAGTGITISGNVISASGGGGGLNQILINDIYAFANVGQYYNLMFRIISGESISITNMSGLCSYLLVNGYTMTPGNFNLSNKLPVNGCVKFTADGEYEPVYCMTLVNTGGLRTVAFGVMTGSFKTLDTSLTSGTFMKKVITIPGA